nr:YraN family protein [Bifidobacterium miconis]
MAFRFADIDLTPRQLGALGEQYAAAWLERRGCTVLDRNWRSRYGELDIIAVTPEHIVLFVEVKTRRNARYGTPQEAVTAHKRLALRRAGVQWLLCPEHRMAHRGVRFDVIAITAPVGASPTVNHIREAF